jgi:hypothetical protein
MENRMKRSAVPALILFTALSGCGKFLDNFSRIPGGFTKVVFNHDSQNSHVIGFSAPSAGAGAVQANSVLGGGALIYAHNVLANLTFSGTVADEGGTLALTLPNGDYTFSAVGWPSINLSDPASASVRCGTSPGLTLDGQAKSLTFDLSSVTACASNPFFAPAAATTTNNIDRLTLTFCNQATDISGMGMGGTCPGSKASSSFYAGTATAKVDRVFYYPTAGSSGQFVFTASHDPDHTGGDTSGYPYELFISDMAGGKQTKFPVPLVANSNGVSGGWQPHGHKRLLFVVKDDIQAGTLYSYNLTTSALTQISLTNAGGALGAQDVRVSDDGSFAVYVSQSVSGGPYELFSFPVPADSSDAISPLKISGTLSGSGVTSCSGCGGDKNFYFDITRGSAPYLVVFSGYDSVHSVTDLQFAAIDHSTLIATTSGYLPSSTSVYNGIISYSEINAGDTTDRFDFSANGRELLYHATVSGVPQAYSLHLGFTGNVLTASNPHLLVSNVTSPGFKMGNSTARAVIFTGTSPVGNNATTTVVSALLSDSVPSPTTIITETATGAYLTVEGAKLSPDDTQVILSFAEYGTPNNGPVRDIVSSSTSVGTQFSYFSGVLTTNQVRRMGSQAKNDSFRVSPNATTGLGKITFLADLGAPGTYEVYQANPASLPAVMATHIGAFATASAISSGFGPDGNLYFAASYNSALPELYLSLGAGSAPLRLNSGGAMDSVDDLAGDSDLALAGVVPMQAHPLGYPSVKSPFLYKISSNTFSPLGRIGAMGITSMDPSGVGRVKITMLKNDNGVTLSTAFDSGCLAFTGNTNLDGVTGLFSPARVPLGAGGGGFSPFATQIDVYPLATDCNGPSQQYNFPNGIASAYNNLTGGALLKAGSTNAQLFLQDQ